MPWNIFVPFSAFLAGIIPYIYVGWRLTRSLSSLFPDSIKYIRYSVVTIFVFLNFMPVLFFFYSGLDRTGQLFVYKHELVLMDYLFNFPFWVGLIIIGEILTYYILIEIIQLISGKVSNTDSARLSRTMNILRIAIFGIMTFYVIIKSYIDTNRIRIKEYTEHIENLPDSLKDLEIVFVADLHIDRYTRGRKIEEFKQKIKSTNPDIFLFSGDMVSRGDYFISDAVETLNFIENHPSKIACFGDHDFWTGINETLVPLQQNGWQILDNEHLLIEHNGSRILITGITYIYSRRISRGNLERLLTTAPEADIKILLVHQPADMVIEAAADKGYDILLGGHSHGGQIVFLPMGFKLTPARFENRLFSGYYRIDDMTAVVSNGIGLTATPLRYNAPAEIIKIVLK